MIWLLLALQDYESIPQSPRVSIDCTNALVSDVCADLSKQARFPVRWKGAQDATITLALSREPLLAAVAEMARILGCNLSEVSTSEGMQLHLPASFFNAPVKAYQMRGPVLLVWYGLAERDKTTRYLTAVFWDRQSQASLFGVRNQPVTFTIGGKSSEVASDHNPNVFTSDRVAWEFEPKKLSGDRATLEVTVPCRAPSEAPSAVVTLAEPQSVKASGTIVLVENYKREDRGVRVDYEATLRVMPATKNPSVQPALHALYLHGPGKDRVAVRFERKGGEYILLHESRDLEFKPEQLEIVWTQNPKEFRLPFKLDVPLR